MSSTFSDPIVKIEKVVLRGKRPRSIGLNARIGAHGQAVTDPVVRICTEGGAVGIGWSSLDRERAESLLGMRPADLFEFPHGSKGAGAAIDLPLWDLAARCERAPLYQLLGGRGSREVELYDGSIYIDDLGATDDQARRIFHEEVRTGYNHGYRNFKIKIGRGARWMPVREGTDRDVLVIHAVREAAGPDAKILVDANNGTTLNIALDILERYAHAHFAAAIPNFSLLEAAPAEMPGIVLDGWQMRNGKLIVPDTPGAGLDVEPDMLERCVKSEGGFRIGIHDR
jgi:L-rhamnonate dehydratase